MTFNQQLFVSILSQIENSLSFKEDNITTPYGWSLYLNLRVQDILDMHSANDQNEIKYILEVLDIMDCIRFASNDHSIIGGITKNGYRFIFSYLHNIEFPLIGDWMRFVHSSFIIKY